MMSSLVSTCLTAVNNFKAAISKKWKAVIKKYIATYIRKVVTGQK